MSNQISSNYRCLSIEFKKLNETFLVDRIEYLDLTLSMSDDMVPIPINTPLGLMNTNGFILKLHQNVRIFVVRQSDLETNNTHESNPIATIDLTLLFDMKFVLKAVDNQLHLVVNYSNVVLPTNIPNLTQEDIDNIESNINLLLYNFEVEPGGLLSSFLGGGLTLSNAGILTDSKGELISFRLELNGPFNESLQCWNQFYSGQALGSCRIKNLLAKNDWAELIDKEIMVESQVIQYSDLINQQQQNGVFNRETGPHGSWIANPPTVGINFTGELIDLCWAVYFFYATEIDVDTDFDVESIFSVPSDNILQMNTKIYWIFNDAEIFECAVTASALWPTVGAMLSPLILGEGQMSLGEMLLANILGPIGVFAIFCNKAGNFYSPDDTLPTQSLCLRYYLLA
jgi:hypothetical protein